MRGFSDQADAEPGNMQADVGSIQQCLEVCAQVSTRIHQIQKTITNVPKPLDNEQFATPDIDRLTTFDVLGEFAELLRSTATQIKDDVAVLRC